MVSLNLFDCIIISSNKPWDHVVDLTLDQDGFYIHFIGLSKDQLNIEYTAFVHTPDAQVVTPTEKGYSTYPISRHIAHSPDYTQELKTTREFLDLTETHNLIQLIAESTAKYRTGERKSSAFKVSLYEDSIENLSQGDNKFLDWHLSSAMEVNNPLRFNVKYTASSQYGGTTEITLAVFTNLNLAMRPEMALHIFNLYQPNALLNNYSEKDRTHTIFNPVSKISVQLNQIKKVELDNSSYTADRVIYNHELFSPRFKLSH